MATYESAETTAILRALAREQLRLLTATVGQLVVGMDLDARLELSAWVCEGRRLLHGDDPVPASCEPPSNVRRLVAVGGRKDGRDFYSAVLGPGGLRARYEDSVQPSTADCYAGATDDGREPPEGTP